MVSRGAGDEDVGAGRKDTIEGRGIRRRRSSRAGVKA